uniref:Ribosomal protein S4 n=1 Tax=Prototheca zopfii TaxID=3112 RepID=A0A2P1G7N1_9CHLO|nr:ribosomal protein S4 [Prototheca bovis]AVM80954.1 ribosomal protein S4 [Prototheca bovis]
MSEFTVNSNTQAKQHQKQLFNKCLNIINLEQGPRLKSNKNWHYFDNLMHLREYRDPYLMKKTLIKENGTWKINSDKVHSQSTQNINFLFSSDQFQYHTKNQSNTNFRFKNQSNSIARPKEFNEIYNTRKKLSLFYGYLSTEKIQNLIIKAKQYPGYFSKNFFALLEQRLDVALYRSGLVPSIMAARQVCAHGKVKVNSQICTKSNTALKPGDVITLKTNETIANQTKKETSEIFDQSIRFINKSKNPNKKIRKFYNRTIKNIIIGSSTVSIVSNTKIKANQKFRFNVLLKFLLNALRARTMKNSKNVFQFKYNSLVDSTLGVHLLLKKLRKTRIPKTFFWIRNRQFRTYKALKKARKIAKTNKQQITRLFSTKANIKKKIKKNLLITQVNHTNLRVKRKLQVNIIFHFLAQYCQSSLLRQKNLIYSTIKNVNKVLNKPQLLKRSQNPTHLEISAKTNTFVYLFAPQRIKLPFIVDIDILKKLTKF